MNKHKRNTKRNQCTSIIIASLSIALLCALNSYHEASTTIEKLENDRQGITYYLQGIYNGNGVFELSNGNNYSVEHGAYTANQPYIIQLYDNNTPTDPTDDIITYIGQI